MGCDGGVNASFMQRLALETEKSLILIRASKVYKALKPLTLLLINKSRCSRSFVNTRIWVGFHNKGLFLVSYFR